MAVEIKAPSGSATARTDNWAIDASSNGYSANAKPVTWIAEAISSVSSLPSYLGPYEVTPTIAPQVLETRAHQMADDLTVDGIPRYDVSNEYGVTVSIG